MVHDIQQKIREGIALRSLSKENFTRSYKSFEIAKEICDKYPNILYFDVEEV
ncbi:hypothetical protein V757_08170 [Pelistega indica]|uniref:Uncharacterized protein n=2 Tax=Pelistega TaxID=106146 RepID=V8G0U2_9BURK|nr:hypothetical protein V757_08170 [Pelistega indica]